MGPADGNGIGFRQGLLVVCGILLVLFFVLNLQQVQVHLLIATVKMPLIIALAIAALLGLLLGWAVPRLRRGGTSS
ncbi:MAG TPA: lipopolysaccharide assembly protein LapA domain-containing protein [Solirubrobacterales bacterium]|nr:lipopolysaccharide assembly protein LapA domain-containing protein [Solirubrobacterales bacterium]